MLAFALRADGWYLRSDIIWHKPNPMPESVTDRPTKAHEYLFLMSKSERYYYDQEAILEPVSEATQSRLAQNIQAQIGSTRAHAGDKTNGNMKAVGRKASGTPRNDGSRWNENNGRGFVSRRPKAWDNDMGSNRTLVAGLARKLDGDKIHGNMPGRSDGGAACNKPDQTERNKRTVWTVNTQSFSEADFATFPEELIKPCILAGCPAGGTVLDPFGGSGATALVARANGCKAILIELNPEYIEIAKRRLAQEHLEFV
jgi:DNA modification methylase